MLSALHPNKLRIFVFHFLLDLASEAKSSNSSDETLHRWCAVAYTRSESLSPQCILHISYNNIAITYTLRHEWIDGYIVKITATKWMFPKRNELNGIYGGKNLNIWRKMFVICDVSMKNTTFDHTKWSSMFFSLCINR